MTRDVWAIFLFFVNTRPLRTSMTHGTQRLASYELTSHLEKAGKSSQRIHLGKSLLVAMRDQCVKCE